MFGSTPWERMRTALLVAGGLVLWVRYQDSLASRPNFNSQLYFEDTSNSELPPGGTGRAGAGWRWLLAAPP
jgi:hypothetical protein